MVMQHKKVTFYSITIQCERLWMKALMLVLDDRPFVIACWHTRWNSLAFVLISFTSSFSKFINFCTSLDISTLVTKLSVPISCFTLHLVFQSSTISLLFKIWAKIMGYVRKGRPHNIHSQVELHPQCDKKPPTEEWDKTLNWLHQGTTNSIWPQTSFNLLVSSRATQKNLTLLSHKPTAISSIWAMETERKLPIEIYRTELLGWQSSQYR